jgi:quinol monooxygenase YgiN
MPATVTVTVDVKPGKKEELIQLMKGALPDTRSFNGCLSINVLSDHTNPNRLMLYEVWESKGQYDKYLAWRTQTGMLEKLKEYLVKDPVFAFWNPVGV